MSDVPVTLAAEAFPIRIERFATEGLPLAAARNRAAACARQERLLFLDVDCIPMRGCLGRLADALDAEDGLFCADVRYLGSGDADGEWNEPALLARGRPHTARRFPKVGLRVEPNPGLFWSLAFAIRTRCFHALGGFDERYEGYGGEDTDFGFRASEAGVPLLFVGGAIACHQFHETHDPPVQHVRSIVANARRFHDRWGRWPMEGWLSGFAAMRLVEWTPDELALCRLPTTAELAATRIKR